MAFLVQTLRRVGLFLVIPKVLSVSIFQAKLHSCHDMLNEIFGKIYDIVNDMCIATTKAEVYMDVPDIATAPMRKRSKRPSNWTCYKNEMYKKRWKQLNSIVISDQRCTVTQSLSPFSCPEVTESPLAPRSARHPWSLSQWPCKHLLIRAKMTCAKRSVKESHSPGYCTTKWYIIVLQ